MIVEQLSDFRIRVVIDEGRPLLGISTGVPSSGFSAQKVSAQAIHGGLIVGDGRSTPWTIERVVPYMDVLYLCGPWLDGQTVAEALEESSSLGAETQAQPLSPPRTLVEAVLSATTTVLTTSHDTDEPSHALCSIHTSLLTRERGLLFLDRRLVAEIERYAPFETRQRSIFPYLSRRLDPWGRAVYLAATITWHAISGNPVCPPENAVSEEEAERCHELLRRTPNIHRVAPRTPEPVATALASLIASPDRGAQGILSRLKKEIESQGLTEEISEAEAERRVQEGNVSFDKTARGLARRVFFRTRGQTIALVVGVIVLVGIIPFQIVRARLAPPVTAGMRPPEIVSTFYEAWGSLDHVFMDDALASDVGRAIVREVTNVYVVDRVRFAHEMGSELMPVYEWVAAGAPEGSIPYGPLVHEMTTIRQGEDESEFVVEYDLWRPAGQDGSDSTESGESDGRLLTVVRRREHLTLTPVRSGWQISDLETVQVSPPVTGTARELRERFVSPRQD